MQVSNTLNHQTHTCVQTKHQSTKYQIHKHPKTQITQNHTTIQVSTISVLYQPQTLQVSAKSKFNKTSKIKKISKTPKINKTPKNHQNSKNHPNQKITKIPKTHQVQGKYPKFKKIPKLPKIP